jgi:hypothetical protein
VSVKDRWVGPREQVLNVPIACQCYGPSKPSSLPSKESGFTPTAQWLTQERNWVRTCGSDGRRAMDCVGSPFFSGDVALFIPVDDCAKGCYMWTT